ncbi:MAG: 6-bladed beta-propeller [Bacteroidales bacterium]
MKNKYLIIIIPFLIFGCSGHYQKDSVLIEIENENNSPAFCEIKINKIIPLETTDSSILGKITKIQKYEDKWYVFDFLHNRSIVCFNKDGEYRYHVSRGKGPGEIITPSDFYVHKDKLFIKDNNCMAIYEHKNGEFIDKIKTNNLLFNKFIISQSDNILTFGYSPPKKIIEKDKIKPNVVKESINLYKLLNNNYEETKYFLKGNYEFKYFVPHKPISKFGDHLLCLYPPSTEIYNYHKGDVKLAYKIDFGENSFRKHELNKDIDFYISRIKEKKRIGFIDDINETSDFISFSFVKNIGEKSFALFSKKSHNTVKFKLLLKNNKLPDMSILSTFNDQFIGVFYPSKIEKKELKQLSKKWNLPDTLTQFSNPVVVIFRLTEK